MKKIKTILKLIVCIFIISSLVFGVFYVKNNYAKMVGDGIDISINKDGININKANKYKNLELELKESQIKLIEYSQQLESLNYQLVQLNASDTATEMEIAEINNQIEIVNSNIALLNTRLEEIKNELIQLNETLYKDKIRLFGALKNNVSFVGQTWQTLKSVEFDLSSDCDIFSFCSVVAYVDWGTLHVAIFIDGKNVRQVGSNCTLANTVVPSSVISLSSGHHVIEFKVQTDNNTNKVTLPNYCENSYTIIEL